MDAANLTFKRISFSVALALLMPAAAYAQPAFSISPTSVTLTGQAPGQVGVTSTSTNIGFEATVAYPTNDVNWLCVTNGGASTTPIAQGGSVTGLTTPVNLTLTVCGSPSPFVTTHTATITLTATDASGAAASSFGVSYTLGSGGGGGSGSVVASPSSITETISYGSQVGPLYITLSTSSATPISFTLPGTPSWITLYQSAGNSGFVSSAQPAVLAVSLNGAGQAETSLTTTIAVSAATGTVSIPVTLNNGVNGGSGSGGTGSLSVYPSTLSWAYSSSSSGTFPNPTTLTMSSTNGQITYSATATSSNGWLLINSSYVASGTVGVTPLTLSPSQNLASLAPGTYNGTVAITGSDGSTGSVTVTVTVSGTNSGSLTISPSPIPLAAAVNGSTTQATVSITSAVSGVLTATASGSGISLSVSTQNVTANVPVTLTVFGNPSGLTNGTYVGALNVSVAGNTAGAQINFVVGTGSSTGGGTAAGASPAQLTFYYEPNSSMQTIQAQQVYISGTGNFSVAATSSTSPSWLTVSATSGTLPFTLYVEASTTGLASGTYNGSVTITNLSTGQTSVIGVSLLVQGIATIYASPGDQVFNYIGGVSSLVQVQQIAVQASDNSVVPVSATVSNASNTPWLTASGSGTTPVNVTVTTNASNLANGVYGGSVIVTGGNNTLTIPIVLVVTGSSVTSGSGPLTLSSTSLTLQAPINGATASQSVSVSTSTTTVFTASAQANYNGITWLSVFPSGTTTAPTTITITASPSGLPAGSYSGEVFLVSNGVTQTIQVSFIVGSASNSVVVTANGGTSTAPSLTFTAASVGATLPTQYLTVSSTAGESSVLFTASASTTSGGNWIQLGTASGAEYSTPFTTLTVTANTIGLAGGTYSGTITISPVSGTAVSVPVTLTITAAPAIAVSTNNLSFNYQAGGATPATQTVAVTVSNGSTGSFTATAASTPAAWLLVSPASGTAPGNLTVSINPAGLAAGTYSGTIAVAGSSGSTGNATVNVSVTVTVPLPTITAVVNGASFVNEQISPGEIITIGGTNIGPATPQSFTVTTVGTTPTVSSAGLGGVQVLINGYAAPLLYVSATQINCIVPYEIAGILNPTVLVKFLGQSSNGFTVNAGASAPGIFTANGSGSGPGAILDSDSVTSNVTTAAARGTVVVVYLTGEGQTNPAGIDGKVTSAPYPAPLLPIAITVGGQAANFQFAGEAPGLVSGVMQLNVTIPSTLTVTGNVPLIVSIGSATSQGGVTVNIR